MVDLYEIEDIPQFLQEAHKLQDTHDPKFQMMNDDDAEFVDVDFDDEYEDDDNPQSLKSI